ncbi:MAG: hypothetical protein JRJ44_04730 [Deltaproteobacteria bacterium]|nr:hypothetical protein [Deltaproteobacteria bacterium]
MDFKKCSKINNNKIISTYENHKAFIINNVGLRIISKVKVDGCLITDDRIRCDYLFEIDEPIRKVIYLELKGKNVNKAYEQLEATIGYLKKRHNSKVVKKRAYIISSRVPQAGADVQQLKSSMAKDCNVQLVVRNRKVEIAI